MENNQLAFDVAEREFGIPPVTTGKEMASAQEPDKLSMVMYLSKFYELFRGTPLRPVGKALLWGVTLLHPWAISAPCPCLDALLSGVICSGAGPAFPLTLRPNGSGPHPPRPVCVSGCVWQVPRKVEGLPLWLGGHGWSYTAPTQLTCIFRCG